MRVLPLVVALPASATGPIPTPDVREIMSQSHDPAGPPPGSAKSESWHNPVAVFASAIACGGLLQIAPDLGALAIALIGGVIGKGLAMLLVPDRAPDLSDARPLSATAEKESGPAARGRSPMSAESWQSRRVTPPGVVDSSNKPTPASEEPPTPAGEKVGLGTVVLVCLVGWGCYAVLGVAMPLVTTGPVCLRAVIVIAVGVGLIRWVKAGTRAAARPWWELVWVAFFALDAAVSLDAVHDTQRAQDQNPAQAAAVADHGAGGAPSSSSPGDGDIVAGAKAFLAGDEATGRKQSEEVLDVAREGLRRGLTMFEAGRITGASAKVDIYKPGEAIPDFNIQAPRRGAFVTRHMPFAVQETDQPRYRITLLFVPNADNRPILDRWVFRSPE